MSEGEFWSVRPGRDEVIVELAPAGFRGANRTTLALFAMIGVFALPFGLMGLYGGLFFHDFPPALRIVMGVLGGAALVAMSWLPTRLVLRALAVRSRVRVRPGGVFVEQGITAPRQAEWFSPRSAVKVALGGGGITIRCGQRGLRIGVGFTAEAAVQVRGALESTLRAHGPDAPDDGPPAREPVGPSWPLRLRALGRDFVRPLVHPTPFVVLDLGALLGTIAIAWVWTDVVDRRHAHSLAFVVFLAGLAARRLDASYIAGLRRWFERSPLGSAYFMIAGVVMAGAALLGSGPQLGFRIGLGLGVAAVVLHWVLLRRAAAPPPPARGRGLDFVLAATLIPISVLHEVAMFEFLGAARHLGPFALAFVPTLVGFVYLPVRMHAFLDEPDVRANVVWFWFTVAWLTLQPLIAFAVEFARRLAR